MDRYASDKAGLSDAMKQRIASIMMIVPEMVIQMRLTKSQNLVAFMTAHYFLFAESSNIDPKPQPLLVARFHRTRPTLSWSRHDL